jgi:DNA-binding CsgD family transcriptional regulator
MATLFPARVPRGGLTGRRREREVLNRLVNSVRAGTSQALVVHGEAGVGKTTLLEYVAELAADYPLARAAGVQPQMELPFAGLRQLLVPMLARLDRLPGPQREALRTALGLGAGLPPDPFFVGLAVLSLLRDVAEERPLMCLIDDEQWLDRASSQVLGFVARRLGAESVGMVFAARMPSDQISGLPQLAVPGLGDVEAYTLLDSVLTAPLDQRVRDQIVAETSGNPLALLEQVRDLTPADVAGGFGLPGGVQPSGSIDETFRRRIGELPAQSRRLLQLAAADSVGDPVLMWRAAKRLGISVDAAVPAAEAYLLDIDARVRFRHSLVRSAAYWSASVEERQDVHRALAEVTDPQVDPDRHAWHRAHSTLGPDEDVAGELQRSAGRARARGGLAASAAFLEQSALLTPEPGRRAERTLAAAWAKRDAGAPDAALRLLVAVEAGPTDALRNSEVDHLRGRVAVMQLRGAEAAKLLLRAAKRYQPLNAGLARATHLEALRAALWVGDLNGPGGLREVAESARAMPSDPEPRQPIRALLDAFARRITDGYTSAAPALTRAMEQFLAQGVADRETGDWLWLFGASISAEFAVELWDVESWHAAAARLVRLARDSGAFVHLHYARHILAQTHFLTGELATAARLIEENRAIDEATGNPPTSYTAAMLSAWRGHQETPELIEATLRSGTTHGLGRVVTFATYASSVLYNGLGRHDAARDAAWQVFEGDQFGFGPLVVPELAEAASKTGDVALAEAALAWLSERTDATPTEWALGIEARVRALLSQDDVAESYYRESIERLGRTRLRMEHARAHLLFGEWLRGRDRRADARAQMRVAHEMFASFGAEAFADRARRALAASGDTLRRHTHEKDDKLTAQEAHIAQLARAGLSNPQIGARLFISPRTVQYHLSKVFAKLDINSRSQLEHVLPATYTLPN